MKITLTRFYNGEDCTLGALSNDKGLLCYMLENPWLDNEPFKSCIPEGTYPFKSYTSDKFPYTWEIYDVKGRSGILVHPGNYVKDTEGCLLPGLHLIKNKGEKMVTHSRKTLNMLRSTIGVGRSGAIEIRSVENL